MGQNQRLSVVACICDRCIPRQQSQLILIQSYFLWRSYQKPSSRLGPQKLRKFFQFYSQCYQNSKMNKKLRQSIQKAEQRLSQNNQDVSIYELLRSQIKMKAKRNTLSDSRMSSEQKNQNFDSIQPGKDLINEVKRKSNGGVSRQKNKRVNKNRINNFANFPQIQNQKSINLLRINNQIQFQVNKDKNQKKQQNQIINLQDEQPNVLKQSNQNMNRFGIATKSTQSFPLLINQQVKNIRRKGRPRKSQTLKKQQSDYKQSQQQKPKQQTSQKKFINKNRRINGRTKFRSTSKTLQTLTQEQASIIKDNMNNRNKLVGILLDMQIHVQNIKQILDLGVSVKLQDGDLDKNSHLLLNILKTTLIHKYFPRENKHIKILKKLTKQKTYQAKRNRQFNQYQINSEQVIEGQNMFMKHNNNKNQKNLQKSIKKLKSKQKSVQYQPLKLKQIRVKAINKIEKIIIMSGVIEQAKELAIQLQNTFQQSAQAKGLLYRMVAYQRLRNIKNQLANLRQKKTDAEQVKMFLKQLLHQYRQSIKDKEFY